MNWRQGIFALMAIAAAGSALARAPAPTAKSDTERLVRLLVHEGYTVENQHAMGDALTIIEFSSASCHGMAVMPVSVILQESALLKEVGNGNRYFVYRAEHWQVAAQPPVALAHVAQQFLEIARPAPRPAVDTMLYFVVPAACRAPLDWSDFWQPDRDKAS